MVSISPDSTDDPIQGIVLWSLGHRAQIRIGDENHRLAIPGKWRLRNSGVKPLSPGDRVSLVREGNFIRLSGILPRDSEFTRKAPGSKPISQTIAANLDTALIVASIAEPETPFGLVDRLLLTARAGSIPEIHLIVNKIDLATGEDQVKWKKNYSRAVDSILFTSCITLTGINTVRNLLKDKIVLLAGSSGIGKSTIINRVDPDLNIKTGRISAATGKGRHITSQAQLHPLKTGGWITDTPGLRECAPWDIEPLDLAKYFPEMSELLGACRFRDCLHDSESGCNVKDAVGTVNFPEGRYNSYLKLLDEIKIASQQTSW